MPVQKKQTPKQKAVKVGSTSKSVRVIQKITKLQRERQRIAKRLVRKPNKRPPPKPPAPLAPPTPPTPVKRALLVGINYTGTSQQLNGCINDVVEVSKLLTSLKYHEIVSLTDEASNLRTNKRPTRDNIVYWIKEMLKKTGEGDTLVFYYSGHGSYTRDTNSDEADGKDELICPVDFATGRGLTDDEMNSLFINNLHSGAKLRCIFDCCHSGSMLDLQYRYAQFRRQEIDSTRSTTKNIICLSGCKDDQYSYETWVGKARGALSVNFITCAKRILEGMPSITSTWSDLCNMVRENFESINEIQYPQISTSQIEYLNSNFDI
jgi:hypothetical protein